MTRNLGSIALVMAFSAGALGQDAPKTPDVPVTVTIKAGKHERKQTPIWFDVDGSRLGYWVKSFADSHANTPISVKNPDGSIAANPAEVEVLSADPTKYRVTWVLSTPIPAGGESKFTFDLGLNANGTSPWKATVPEIKSPNTDLNEPASIKLTHDKRPVFTYNITPISNPSYKEIQNRSAYLHPVYSPRGNLITGDFSPSHPHHRGFFLAYERTRTDELTPDFWNLQKGTGKVRSESKYTPYTGVVTARTTVDHTWEATDIARGKMVDVLSESWTIEAYDIPGSPYWLFDIISTQQAIGRPMELLPYRYGGMAYRGPEPFVKGKLDVLTSDGLHRVDGDQKPARWVDLTGPIAEDSLLYAGAMIADHPSNPRYPNVARIHPTTLPFFCFVPAYDKPLTIAVEAPTVFKYRVMIHDGKPDAALDERIARDFAEPPEVIVEPAKG